jgi:hypothetical protein
MGNLEIIFLGILMVLFIVMVVLGCYLSIIADKLQDINRNIYWLGEEDDE